MPLPEAKPDKRIYELLKNVDLENLTFADLQAVGQTIFAEQGAEDELRRLVLVNLARLSTVGEWTGLTTAGGGTGGISIAESPRYGAIERFNLTKIPPYFSSSATASYNINSLGSRTNFYPFLAPKTGTITEIGINLTSTSSGKNLLVGIYESGDQGTPTNKLGDCAISLTTGGTVYQTSITGTISVEKNTQYYIGYVRGDSATGGSYTGPNDDGTSFAMTGSNALNTDQQRGLVIGATGVTTFTLDATYDAADLYPQGSQGLAPSFSVIIT